jgi:hypothetical protein
MLSHWRSTGRNAYQLQLKWLAASGVFFWITGVAVFHLQQPSEELQLILAVQGFQSDLSDGAFDGLLISTYVLGALAYLLVLLGHAWALPTLIVLVFLGATMHLFAGVAIELGYAGLAQYAMTLIDGAMLAMLWFGRRQPGEV